MERWLAFGGKNRLASLIELGRPWNAFPTALIATLAAFMGGAPLSIGLMAGASLFFIYLAGAIINDLEDYCVDVENMPFRPLQRGSVKPRDALAFSIACYAMSLIIAALVNWVFFGVIVVFVIFSHQYSGWPLRAVTRSFYAQVHLGVTTALLPGIGGFAAALNALPSLAQLLPFVAFTAFFFFVWIIKDYKDVNGDRKMGKFTVIVHLGGKTCFWIMLVGSTVMFPVTAWLFYQALRNQLLLVVAGLVLVITIYSEWFAAFRSGEKGFAIFRIGFVAFLLALLGSALSLH